MEELEFEIPYASFEDIPQEEYKNLFKQYWTFIARNHLDYKPYVVGNNRDYKPYVVGNNRDYILFPNFCFACIYAIFYKKSEGKCTDCPLTKFRGNTSYQYPCIMSMSAYVMWIQTKSPRWAMEVAQLEWED